MAFKFLVHVAHAVAVVGMLLPLASRTKLNEGAGVRDGMERHAHAALIEEPYGMGNAWRLQWHDEFDGDSVNRSNWNVGTLKAANGDIVPGAKSEFFLVSPYMDYVREDDVLIGDGTLKLRAQKRTNRGIQLLDGTRRDFEYTSGWVQSMHKVFYTYGWAEARIRFPLGKKVWAAFWTIEERLVWGAEFDIAEFVGNPWGTDENGKPAGLGQHLKTGDYPEEHWISSWKVMCEDPLPRSENCDVTDWHTYALNWHPQGFDYYIDGHLRKRVLRENVTEFPTKDMYFVLNNGIRSGEHLAADDTEFPNYVEFDYVSLWTQDLTRA